MELRRKIQGKKVDNRRSDKTNYVTIVGGWVILAIEKDRVYDEKRKKRSLWKGGGGSGGYTKKFNNVLEKKNFNQSIEKRKVFQKTQ